METKLAPPPLTPEEQEVVELASSAIAGISADAPPDQRQLVEADVARFIDEFDGRQRMLQRLEEQLLDNERGREWVRSILAQLSTEEAEALVEAHPEAIADNEIVDRFEAKNFVTTPPRFDEQLQDDSRTTVFTFERHRGYTFSQRDKKVPERPEQMTEIAGLRELGGTLDDFIRTFDKPSRRKDGHSTLELGWAKSIRHNLTFIGQAEFDEAVHGIASLWKAYLDADPKRQICVLTQATNRQRSGTDTDRTKSDKYVKSHVISALGDMGEGYEGRVVDQLEELSVPPKDARVVILDDWSVTGSQLFDTTSKLLKNNPLARHYQQSMEINLLAAPRERIKQGLKVPYGQNTAQLPVRAYYQAFDANKGNEVPSHISGTHAAVNWGFSNTVQGIVKHMNSYRALLQRPHEVPALASIYPSYWQDFDPHTSGKVETKRG